MKGSMKLTKLFPKPSSLHKQMKKENKTSISKIINLVRYFNWQKKQLGYISNFNTGYVDDTSSIYPHMSTNEDHIPN